MFAEAHACQMEPWGRAAAEERGTGAESLDLRPAPRRREAPTAPPPFSSRCIKPLPARPPPTPRPMLIPASSEFKVRKQASGLAGGRSQRRDLLTGRSCAPCRALREAGQGLPLRDSPAQRLQPEGRLRSWPPKPDGLGEDP